MKDTMEIGQPPSMATTIINYVLNRFMPFVCVLGILIYVCGYDSSVPYAVFGFMWFATKFSFDCGVASAIIEHELKFIEVSMSEMDIDEETEEQSEKEEGK